MHVLMTADTCGGVWTQAVELCRGLAGRAVRVTLATSGGSPSADQRASVGELPGVTLHASDRKLEWMPDPWAQVDAQGDLLERLAAEVRPDVVHLNEFSHGTRDFGRPVLAVGHSDVCSWFAAVRGREPGPGWDGYRRRVRAGLAGADLVAAPTAWMLGELSRWHGPFARTAVLPNGIGATPVPAPGRSGPPRVFAAGRFWDEAKNFAALAAVAPRLGRPVRLAGLPDPVGDRPPPAGVEFLGRLDAADMAAAYRDAAIYCLPAKYEPFGLTPLEAARSGCALVLGDVPSLREVWGDAAAFVPPDDPGALFDTLHALTRDRGRRAVLGRAALARSARHTRDAMTDAYLAAYESLPDAPDRLQFTVVPRG